MTTLERPKQYRSSRTGTFERVKLAPGETARERFRAWLACQEPQPPACQLHPQERFVLTPGASRIGEAYVAPDGSPCTVFDEDAQEAPDAFEFTASFRCPACAAAYARCPREFHQRGFAGFDTGTAERAHALATCRAFAAQVTAHHCGNLLMVGRTGTGKTRLACGIVRELDERSPLYVRQGELTLALRATYGRKDVILHRGSLSEHDDDPPPPGPLDIAQKASLLILDELGCQPLANDERLLLDELVKVRFDERLPSSYLSNLPLDELKTFLGDACFERIRYATGNGKFILQLNGDSYRRTAGEDYLRPLPALP